MTEKMFATKIEFHPYLRHWVVWLESQAYRDGNVYADAYLAGEYGYFPEGEKSVREWCVKMGWEFAEPTEYKFIRTDSPFLGSGYSVKVAHA
jgi:hypothetical protein